VAKLFRLWGKKRGSRMSGWWVVGSLSEASFYGLLFLLGIVSLTIVVTWNLFWPESNIYQIGFGFWLMVIASSSFVLIGLTAFLYRVTQVLASPELRSVMLDNAKREHHRRSVGKTNTVETSLPNAASLMDSPGVRLAYRLAPQRMDTAPLIVSAIFAVAWNALLAILVVISVANHLSGRHAWFLTVLLIPFGVVSFLATRWFFRLFRRHTGVGPTTLEISELPLLPGNEYALYLCQYGRVTFKDLKVSLACFEETTYQLGTDVRTERSEVGRQVVLGPQEFVVEPEKPLEVDCQFRLPLDTMHSFQSSHNAIVWKIIVEGVAPRWRSFCRSFPIVVHPRPVASREPPQRDVPSLR
jgi:hypothetical protein